MVNEARATLAIAVMHVEGDRPSPLDLYLTNQA
jgi:hypothetical protein